MYAKEEMVTHGEHSIANGESPASKTSLSF